MFAGGFLYLIFERRLAVTQTTKGGPQEHPLSNDFSRGIIGIQVGLVGLSMLVTRSSVTSLRARLGLPLGTQIVGWVVLSKFTTARFITVTDDCLVASLVIPFLHNLQPNSHYLHRLVTIFLTFSPIFVILTISYEGLFYFAFCTTLITWTRLEHRIYALDYYISPSTSSSKPAMNGHAKAPPATQIYSGSSYRPLTLSDARISLFFLFLLQSAFFSTGNIASISSFSLDAVYRLIPVFDPFSQGALLLLKLMTPFALISAHLAILNRRIDVAPSSLFMVVMAACDYLTIRFFYMVRDEGSWLDIGTSISHFVIASLLCVFVAGLEWVGEGLVRGVRFDEGEKGIVGIGQSIDSKDAAQNGSLGTQKHQ